MKPQKKSAPIKAFITAVCLLGLAACDNIQWPHVFNGNEVPQSVVDEPSPVEMPPPPPAGGNTRWLRLGDVPSRPTDFMSPQISDQIKQDMENDKAQSDVERERVEPPAGDGM
jgi:hypothetical protein